MLRKEAKQLNFYSQLYHLIPENHILKLINAAISLNFVNEMLESSYCKNFGRPAKEPEMMLRLLIIQQLYSLSDEKLLNETRVNLANLWFIGLNPDDILPHPSLLAKFRTMRLKDIQIDDIMTEVIRQCVLRGIIPEDNGASVDTTHILANTNKLVPERIMKHLAKKIFKAMDKTDYEIPDYKQIENHHEAKRVMKEYLLDVIKEAGECAKEEVKEEAKKAREILESPMFIEQRGIRSLVDTDARVGHKSKTDNFFGYKAEYTMTTNGRLITGVSVHHGAYVDGSDFKGLYERTIRSGLKVSAVYGDKAYFKKEILDILKADNTVAYIPVSACCYQVDEELFSYNKDSDQWFCINGNHTVSKKLNKTTYKDRGEYRCYEYIFDKEGCINCPNKERCMKKSKAKSKKLRIGLNTAEYYEHSQFAKTEEFLEEYKKRAQIEWKNAELKRFHGLARARGYGLRSVSLQVKLVALAVNLKRIAAIKSSLNGDILFFLGFMENFRHNFPQNQKDNHRVA